MAQSESDLIIKFMAEQVNVVKQIDQILAKLDRMEKGLQDAGRKAQKLGDRVTAGFLRAGNAVRRGVSNMGTYLGMAGLAGIFYKATRSAAAFETKLAEVGTLLGKEGPKQIRQYEQAIRQMSRNTSASVTELTSALYQTISAGVRGSETVAGSMKLVETAQKAAVAGVSDTTTAVDLLTTILNSYGRSAEDVTQVSDYLFGAVKAGKTTFGEMASQLGQITAIAAGAGVPIEELSAAVAALTKNGLQTDIAVTALGATFARLLDPSKELNKVLGGSAAQVLKEKGLVAVMNMINEATRGDSEAIQKLGFDMRAFRGVSVLAGKGLGDLNKTLVEMQNSAGATEQAYAVMSDTFEQKSQRFWNRLSDVLIELGNVLLPMLTSALEDFGNWVDNNKDAIRNFFQDILHGIRAIINAWRDAIQGIKTFRKELSQVWGEEAQYREALGRQRAGKATWIDEAILKELGPKYAQKYYEQIYGAGAGGRGGAAPTTGAASGPGLLGRALGEAAIGLEAGMSPAQQAEMDAAKKKHDKDREDALKRLMRIEQNALMAINRLRIANAEGIFQLRLKHEQELLKVAAMQFASEDQRQAYIEELRKKQRKEIEDYYDKLFQIRVEAEQEILRRARESVKEYSKIVGTIGGAELETKEEKRFFKQYEIEPEPDFLDRIYSGFLERAGSKLLDMAQFGAGVIGRPFEQIGNLLGGAFGIDGVDVTRQATDQAVALWEGLTENLGPILEWIANEGLPRIMEAFVESLPIIINAVVEWLPVIVQRIISYIPDIVGAFIAQVPYIVYAFIKHIPMLALEIGKAVARVVLNVATLGIADKGKGGAGTFHEGGVVPDVAAPTFHQGGMVSYRQQGARSSSWRREWTAADFAKALRAHSGMFIKSGLRRDEVPIIAQAGEGILNRMAVSALGGREGVDALNRGRAGSNVVHIHNTVRTDHLYAEDAAGVVDKMVSQMYSDRDGHLRQLVEPEVAGFKSRRKG